MKRKLLIAFVAMVCALCCAFGLAACGGNNNDDTDAAKYLTYRLQDDGTYEVNLDKDNRELVFHDREKPMHCYIPSEYMGKPVTAIGDNMFLGRSFITEITIPDSIKTIGQQAFDNSSITSINLPNGLTSIGVSAFSGCKFTDIIIPNSVLSIGERAFSHCNGLTSIFIPNSVTSLGEGVFEDCSNLESITLGNGLTEIEYGALEGCDKLESLTLKFPEDKIIQHGHGETGYQSYSLRHIFGGGSASLKKLIVTSGEFVGGFNNGFTALKNIVLDSGVYLRSDSVFNDCPSLEYNEYENGLYLGNNTNKYLFLIKAKNTDIVSFTIHESTNTICSSAFRNCDKLTTVEVSGFEFRKANSKTEKISLKELFNLGQETSTVKTIKVANGVTYMPEKATYFALTELILPNTLTEIAGNAILSEQITTITYKGTKAQFKQIEMNWGWCGGISEINSGATIHCDDGDIFVSWYGQISDK